MTIKPTIPLAPPTFTLYTLADGRQLLMRQNDDETITAVPVVSHITVSGDWFSEAKDFVWKAMFDEAVRRFFQEIVNKFLKEPKDKV